MYSTPSYPPGTLLASRSSADPELYEAARPPSPRGSEGPAPTNENVTLSRRAAHYSTLVFASMVGTLIRLGLEALAEYDGRVVFPLLWAQGVGCGIMGLGLANKNWLVSIYPPLYTAITTGIAGSVTTFSSWMLQGYQAFSKYAKYNRNGLHDTVDGLAYSFATFGIGLATLALGEHIASFRPLLPGKREHRQTPKLDLVVILSAGLSYALALIIYFKAPMKWRHDVTFPLLLAPPGAILRFLLANLNTRSKFKDRFPLGTFIANMTATLVLAGAITASHSSVTTTSCNALNAIQQGFCGCLSTVSTFCVETRSIKGRRWTWGYVFVSVVLGHLFVLFVVGGVGWSRGGLGEICRG